MVEIKDLLKKWSGILLSEEGKKESIRKAISSVINLDIPSEGIRIKGSTVYVNIKPIYKNEILLKQEEIFSKLEEFLGKSSPENIR